MKRNNFPKIQSSFLSCEKDTEIILRKLFVESNYGPQHANYSDILKTLLVVNTKDCLDNMADYKSVIDNISLKDIKEKYFKITPKLKMNEHEDVRSYVWLSFDDFTPNATNPHFRDCTISFDIMCHTDYWDLGDYRLRPLKIAGYIDGILNNARLTGIGILNFMGAAELVFDNELSGYTLLYRAVHADDDRLPFDYER